MWVFTRDGFYSAVHCPSYCQPGEIAVRSRSRRDLGRFIRWLAGRGHVTEMLLTPDGDYCCRVIIPQALWIDYVSEAAGRVDYPDFKEAACHDDRLRHEAYHNCWEALLIWQKRQGE